MKKMSAFLVLGLSAAVGIAQVDPEPRCLTDILIDGGSCALWVDTTNPTECPDEVLETNPCKDTIPSASGFKERTLYMQPCTIRVRVWNPVLSRCVPVVTPPVNMTCYTATGALCGSGNH